MSQQLIAGMWRNVEESTALQRARARLDAATEDQGAEKLRRALASAHETIADGDLTTSESAMLAHHLAWALDTYNEYVSAIEGELEQAHGDVLRAVRDLGEANAETLAVRNGMKLQQGTMDRMRKELEELRAFKASVMRSEDA